MVENVPKTEKKFQKADSLHLSDHPPPQKKTVFISSHQSIAFRPLRPPVILKKLISCGLSEAERFSLFKVKGWYNVPKTAVRGKLGSLLLLKLKTTDGLSAKLV